MVGPPLGGGSGVFAGLIFPRDGRSVWSPGPEMLGLIRPVVLKLALLLEVTTGLLIPSSGDLVPFLLPWSLGCLFFRTKTGNHAVAL